MNFVQKIGFVGLFAMSLAACGGSNQQSGASSSTDTSAPAAAPAAPASTAASASAASSASAVAAAPAAFAQCKVCHSTEAGKVVVGPSLAGVVGRKAGSVSGFAYSDGVKNLGLTWDEASLDKWLTNPAAMAPGTKMTFPGFSDPAQRKAVIDYLKTLK